MSSFLSQVPHASISKLTRLAARSGYEKEWLKLNIRKLKNLGLTESRNPGYRLSPRGVAYLSTQNKRPDVRRQ